MDVMLGNGAGCFSCGEVSFWFRPMREHNFTLNCSCGNDPCEIWKDLRDLNEKEFYYFLFRKHDIVIDSSKNLVWILDGNRYLSKDVQIFHLVTYKDLDELIYSHWKRNNDVVYHLKKVKTYYSRILQLGIRYYSINNNTLIKDPKKNLELICQKLGLIYFEGKEEFWKSRNHHFLFGSNGVRKQMTSKKSKIYVERKFPAEFVGFLQNVQKKQIYKEVEIVMKNIKDNSVLNGGDWNQKKYQSRPKPLWYYRNKFGRKIKRYFPDKYSLNSKT